MPYKRDSKKQGAELKIRLLIGREAKLWMTDEKNASTWRQLHHLFGDNNAYLSEEFVRAWYNCYEGPYKLILLIGEDDRGELMAIMPLAQQGEKLTGAGDYHAEYQGWLCREARSVSFLEASLSEIAQQLPGNVVSLRYVLSNKSRRAIDEVVERIPTAHQFVHHRPLLKLDSDALAATLRKKGNRSKFNRLKKLGKLELARITNIRDFDRYMIDVVAAYDFRQGCVNGTCPFLEDDRKLQFHRHWFESCPHQIELSILFLNDKPIAAFFGVNVGRTVSNAIVAHDPAFAAHSVSKIQIYMFAQELTGTEVDFLDLTPGGDPWKNRFSTRHEEVSEFVFYVSAKHARAIALRQRVARYAKQALAIVGITPDQVRDTVARLHKISIGSLKKRLAVIVGDTTEYRIYRLKIDERPTYNLDPIASRNSLTDLVTYDEGAAWSGRAVFLNEAASRMSRGEIVYTVRSENQLAHYGWVNLCQVASHFTEVAYRYEYRVPGAVLYDFFTHPSSRGQGYYQSTIAQILNDLAAQEEYPDWAYISVLADNGASRHVIEKMGFEYIESVIRIRRWSRSAHRIEKIMSLADRNS